MIVSFYARHLAIVFHFEQHGRLIGILADSLRNIRQEFTGVFETDSKIDMCFMIEWPKTPQLHNCLSAFSGTISDSILNLKWIHIIDEEFKETGRARFIADYHSRDEVPKPDGSNPYPEEVIHSFAEN